MKDTEQQVVSAWVTRITFGALVFFGACLLFIVQPLIGKIVTAQYGGAAAIWCVCVLFFQMVLLLGYLLTFALSRLPVKVQAVLYCVLWAISVAFLKLPPSTKWYSDQSPDPVVSLLTLLSAYIALPCLLLSSVSGLVQTWFASKRMGNPYPLYALSNLGSLGALLLYPVALERIFGLDQTLIIWKLTYIAVAALALFSATLMFIAGSKISSASSAQNSQNASESAASPTSESAASPRPFDYLGWLGLSALGSALLLIYTTYITQDVAPVPFLWVLPLSLYLLSFCLCFADLKYYKRGFFLIAGPILWLVEPFLHQFVALDAICVLAMLFCFCMVSTGELTRRKPNPRHLPLFYLFVAGGGVLGGLFINLVAPMSFDFYAERYAVIFVMLAFCFQATLLEHPPVRFMTSPTLDVVFLGLLTLGCILMDGYQIFAVNHNVIARARNFYGCLSIVEGENEIQLLNGTTIHGAQFTARDQLMTPTRYYVREGGMGYTDTLIRNMRGTTAIKYGIVGLGAGGIAAYGRPGDQLVFYEIDPKVPEVAKRHFSFLSSSPANISIKVADGRKLLEKEAPQSYDVLILDAFNGDAVPTHLVTREAILLYLRQIKFDGILLFHVSNRYVDLEPVLANLAAHLKLHATTITLGHLKYVALTREPLRYAQPDSLPSPNKGVQLSGSKDAKSSHLLSEHLVVSPARPNPTLGLWTDDYTNLFSAMCERLAGGKTH